MLNKNIYLKVFLENEILCKEMFNWLRRLALYDA